MNLDSHPLKGKFTFEISTARKGVIHHDHDIRRQQPRNADVLHRARELGMKIWALEKLQRMMTTMFDADTGTQMPHGHNTRSNSAHSIANTISRSTREADLSQLLRNERINGPSDRDPKVASKEMILFKGPFIYVHDIDEKQKPIMVREYGKVSNKEDGDWPQFRSVANGKCPFVEEVDYSRREAERDTIRQQRQYEREKSAAPRTRAAAAAVEARMQPPKTNNKRTLAETESACNRGSSISVSTKQGNPFSQPQNPSQVLEAEPSSKGPQNAFVSRAAAGRLFGGEPVASGLQQSNITSAIRSQMISSTAAAPGAKAGTSKEVHGLQRKVLEKNSGPASVGLASSHRMTDICATMRDEPGARGSKRKAESLISIEEENYYEAEENARRAEELRKVKAVQKRKVQKKDPKPGYCENCMDKFDDFEEVETPDSFDSNTRLTVHSTSSPASIVGSPRRMRTGENSTPFSANWNGP
jgi:regulatory subunit for Cdc7p protein kinase